MGTIIRQHVKLREDDRPEKTIKLYLDYSLNAKRHREFIDCFLFKKPKNAIERLHNKETLQKAELIRAKRENQYFSDEIDEVIEYKKARKSDFLDYFQTYLNEYDKKDLRVMRAVFHLFKQYAPSPLPADTLTEKLCNNFLNYLHQELSGESPGSYFARFKKVVKQAHKDKILKINPTAEIRVEKANNAVQKDILTIEELQRLANAYCGNAEVKRSFLFACQTGLRFVDIVALRWADVKADKITINQAKTDIWVDVNLNATAQKLLGERGKPDAPVFKLPSHNATLKNLNNWAAKAGIEKHITFHCARHSFGTMLAYHGSHIKTISELLGHTSLHHTQKYVRIADELKTKAVNSLPMIEL